MRETFPTRTSPRPSFFLRSMTGMMRPRRLMTPLMKSGARGHLGDLGDPADLLHQPNVHPVLLAVEEEGGEVLGLFDRGALLARGGREERDGVTAARRLRAPEAGPPPPARASTAKAEAPSRARMSSARPDEGSSKRPRRRARSRRACPRGRPSRPRRSPGQRRPRLPLRTRQSAAPRGVLLRGLGAATDLRLRGFRGRRRPARLLARSLSCVGHASHGFS